MASESKQQKAAEAAEIETSEKESAGTPYSRESGHGASLRRGPRAVSAGTSRATTAEARAIEAGDKAFRQQHGEDAEKAPDRDGGSKRDE